MLSCWWLWAGLSGRASVGRIAADRVFQVVALGFPVQIWCSRRHCNGVWGCRERWINIDDHHAPGIDQDEQMARWRGPMGERAWRSVWGEWPKVMLALSPSMGNRLVTGLFDWVNQ